MNIKPIMLVKFPYNTSMDDIELHSKTIIRQHNNEYITYACINQNPSVSEIEIEVLPISQEIIVRKQILHITLNADMSPSEYKHNFLPKNIEDDYYLVFTSSCQNEATVKVLNPLEITYINCNFDGQKQ